MSLSRKTKAELVDIINIQNSLITSKDKEIQALRLKVSVVEGTKQLFVRKEKPATANTSTRLGEVVVSTYTKRDGTQWNKVRIGFNQYAHRPVVKQAPVPAIERREELAPF